MNYFELLISFLIIFSGILFTLQIMTNIIEKYNYLSENIEKYYILRMAMNDLTENPDVGFVSSFCEITNLSLNKINNALLKKYGKKFYIEVLGEGLNYRTNNSKYGKILIGRICIYNQKPVKIYLGI